MSTKCLTEATVSIIGNTPGFSPGSEHNISSRAEDVSVLTGDGPDLAVFVVGEFTDL